MITSIYDDQSVVYAFCIRLIEMVVTVDTRVVHNVRLCHKSYDSYQEELIENVSIATNKAIKLLSHCVALTYIYSHLANHSHS